MQRRWVVSWIVLGLAGGFSILSRPVQSPLAGSPLFESARIDPPVLAILQRSCADCHSEDTSYPWYSYLVPVSWLINSDVEGGRRHLNFSHWHDYPLVRKERVLTGIANQVRDGEMPLWQYTLIHRNAKLSPADVDSIFQWTQTERARLIAESQR